MVLDDLIKIKEQENSPGKEIHPALLHGGRLHVVQLRAVKDALTKAVQDAGLEADRSKCAAWAACGSAARARWCRWTRTGVTLRRRSLRRTPPSIVGTLKGGKTQRQSRRSECTRSSTDQLSIVLANSGSDRSGSHRILHRGGRLSGLARRAARNDAARMSWTQSSRAACAGAAARVIPTGLKWGTVAKTPSAQKYVICNADEGDPGAFMDRSVLGERSAQRARRHGHRGLRGGRGPGIHLRARGISAGHRAAANRHQTGEANGACWAAAFSNRRSISTSTCASAPARLCAARKRR